MTYRGKLFFFLVFIFSSLNVTSQTGVSLSYQNGSQVEDVDCAFTSINEYLSGKVISNFATIAVFSDQVWDLYVGIETDVPNTLDQISSYSATGDIPSSTIMEMRFRNASSTSLENDFFPLKDINTAPIYIIGSAMIETGVDERFCPQQGTNSAGNWVTTPNCYLFRVDLKITPPLTSQAGLYGANIVFRLVSDL